MKRVRMFILAGGAMICLVSCGSGMTQKEKVNNDLAKLNLKGKVVSLQHNLFMVDDEYDELNEENKRSKVRVLVGYHANWSIAGALLGILTSFDLKFDENGNITKITNYERFSITYNEEDNIKTGETWRWERDASLYKYKYTYNDDGQLISKKAKDEDYEDKDWTVKYKYNEDGLLSAVTLSKEDNEESIRKIEYINKIQVGSFQYIGDGPCKIAFEYNENGDVSKITATQDDNKVTWTFSKYKYDEQGNWIKCVVKENDNDSAVITRKIRYDD